MRTRLKDVAQTLNLSPGLISGVLNGRENVWASEETRERIFRAARELNYQPSTAAQALSRGKSRAVALVYRRLDDPDYRLAHTGLADTFSAELQSRGYDLNIANFATQEEVLERLRFLAAARACDAVVLWGREPDTEPQAELLAQLGVPFIVKGRHEERYPDWYQLDYDHEWMMSNALAELIQQGHRRIAYLGFELEDAFVQALRRGFQQAHQDQFGVEVNPELVRACGDDIESNERHFQFWLGLPLHRRPTAFVLGGGNGAWIALERCLAPLGAVVGTHPGSYGACGIASYSFRLMFGQALAYQGIEIDRLAAWATPRLLDAVLSGIPTETVVRYRPALSRAPSLQLLQHGVALGRGLPAPDPSRI